MREISIEHPLCGARFASPTTISTAPFIDLSLSKLGEYGCKRFFGDSVFAVISFCICYSFQRWFYTMEACGFKYGKEIFAMPSVGSVIGHKFVECEKFDTTEIPQKYQR